MKLFPDTSLHVNVNDSNTCMGNVGVHILQRQLNYLDPDVFPLLGDKSIPIVDIPLNKKMSLEPDDILKRCERRINPNPGKFDYNQIRSIFVFNKLNKIDFYRIRSIP